MNKILLTTESCSDLSKETLEKYHILEIPFSVNFPDRTVYDGQIPVQEIYDFYKETKKIPKTNAVSPYQYTEFFEKVSEEYSGYEIIHIGYSSACSCSFQNAVLGVRECKKAKVHLVDSKNVSGGLGNITLKAAEVIKDNPDATAVELVEKILPYVKKTQTSFIPDTLDFLLAGGRVSNVAAISASILKLKPRIDIIEGKLIAAKKYRGSMVKVVPHFVSDFMNGRMFDKRKVYILYAHGTDEAVIEKLQECLLSEGFQEIEITILGCVMTVHGGKGAIGISATEI
jgi:DegV family protein with EDD domain